nr:unnamed protein product [Callosobruchus analis]
MNETMGIIMGTAHPTPVHWLPVLSHIPPPEPRRKSTLLKKYDRILNNPALPVHGDMQGLERNRLRSRKPPRRSAKQLKEENFTLKDQWQREWTAWYPRLSQAFPCIKNKPPGMEQPRRTWSQLNRVRANHGSCADLLYKCGKLESPMCDC